MRSIIITAFLLILAGLVEAGNEERYTVVDRHALNVPASATKSIETLSSFLTKPFTRDEEKARAIFRWITDNISYDVEGYFSGRTSSDCDNVLESKSSVCGGYSNLFAVLCQKAGLKVVTIGGYGKGFSYHAGDTISGEQNHAWNAVKIRGEWRLIDCTWGAGKVDEEGSYIKEFEPYYFMASPEEFIYRHFPNEKKWQLLQRPVSRREFEELPLVSPVYFQCGLKLTGTQSTVISVTNEYSLNISAPKNVFVSSTLEQNGKVVEDAVFVQRSESKIKICLIPPSAGNYFLHIFANRGKASEKVPLAVSFKIIAYVNIAKSNSFPKIFKTYVETNTQLLGPLAKELPSGSIQKFSLTSPDAEKVAVVCGEEWDFLKKKDEKFEGTIEISAGDVTVFAQYPGKTEFQALLEYKGTGDFQRAPSPMKYGKFMDSGAEIFSPLKKELQAGTKQVFKLKLPGARKAAVVIDEEWYYLEKKENVFEGDINIRKGKIVVLGAYKDTRHFDGLLEYEGK
jgi:hypothetical protein